MEQTSCDLIQNEAIWVSSFFGFLLSALISGLLIYIYYVHHQNSSAQNLQEVITYASIYGLIFSIAWMINLLLVFLVQECSTPGDPNYWCFVLGPIKTFALLMWFFWNGMLIKLIQINLITHSNIDMLMLGEFLKKKFHPICFAISLVAVILPFADHAYGYTQPYPAYNCGIIQTKALGFLIYNISNLLPMWVLALYYIYVFLDAYWIFKKIGRKMPKNNLKLMYQPMVIIATWIWPTLGLFDYFLFKGNLSKSIKAVFMISQSYTILLQSLLFLHHIYKIYPIKLCMDEVEENRLLSLQNSFQNKQSNNLFEEQNLNNQ